MIISNGEAILIFYEIKQTEYYGIVKILLMPEAI